MFIYLNKLSRRSHPPEFNLKLKHTRKSNVVQKQQRGWLWNSAELIRAMVRWKHGRLSEIWKGDKSRYIFICNSIIMTNCQSLYTLLYVSIMFVVFSTSSLLFFSAFVQLTVYWADFHAPASVAAGKPDIAGSRDTQIISWKTLKCKKELENESFLYSSFTLHMITWPFC